MALPPGESSRPTVQGSFPGVLTSIPTPTLCTVQEKVWLSMEHSSLFWIPSPVLSSVQQPPSLPPGISWSKTMHGSTAQSPSVVSPTPSRPPMALPPAKSSRPTVQDSFPGVLTSIPTPTPPTAPARVSLSTVPSSPSTPSSPVLPSTSLPSQVQQFMLRISSLLPEILSWRVMPLSTALSLVQSSTVPVSTTVTPPQASSSGTQPPASSPVPLIRTTVPPTAPARVSRSRTTHSASTVLSRGPCLTSPRFPAIPSTPRVS